MCVCVCVCVCVRARARVRVRACMYERERYQNSRSQKSYMKQVPYWETTNIRKFSRPRRPEFVYLVLHHGPTYYTIGKSKKIKCTLVQGQRLCTGRTAHRGSRGIALLFHDHGTRRGWGIRIMPRPLFNPGKDRVPIIQEAGWAPRPVWTGGENLAPHRDSIPGRSSP